MSVQLRTLGGLELEATGPVPEAAVQPKRLALLAYLLVERPDGFARRDVLLALFWPDLPELRARLALRQALHQLRLIAPDASAIRGRGHAEVGVVPASVTCDASAFETGCRAGDDEALRRYRGDFLEGVHVLGASAEFEEWVTARRRHYRDLAVRAAWGKVTTAERAGVPEHALAAAEQALLLAPDDEPGLRRLMQLLDAAGNRATALRHYDRFARRLAVDLGAAPSPPTRVLAERLRLEGRVPAAR